MKTKIGKNKNTITVTNKGDKPADQVPITFGRPFCMGEIPQYPMVVSHKYGGLVTQADVKTRHPDGSVKHAIITVHISMKAGEEDVWYFENQPTGNLIDGLQKDLVLGRSKAEIKFKFPDGALYDVTPEQLIKKNKVLPWLFGMNVTAFTAEDHVTKELDIGGDEHDSIRPSFHFMFYKLHTIVRFICEISDTTKLQDQWYDFSLHYGGNNLYERKQFLHRAATRWTLAFRIGPEAPEIAFDFNLPYLVSTKAIPNFETKPIVTVPEGVLNGEFEKWKQSKHDIGDPGRWCIAMANSGGRPDIGPYPSWVNYWLHSFRNTELLVACNHAELAGGWPMHLREGEKYRRLNSGDENPHSGLGKILSVTDRKTLCLWDPKNTFDPAQFGQKPEDVITPVGPIVAGSHGWQPDGAHQPNPFTPVYLLTGDLYFLQEAMYWAAYSTARYRAGTYAYGRGPTGAEGGIYDETRGEGWVFRNRCETAWCIPDGWPEKKYFENHIEQCIAIWSGVRGVEYGGLAQKCYQWGKECSGEEFPLGVPPLHHWDDGSEGLVASDPPVCDPIKTAQAISTWEQMMVMYALGRAHELGYNTYRLLEWFGKHINGIMGNPGYDPNLCATYRMPAIQLKNVVLKKQFFDWIDMRDSFHPDYNAVDEFNSYLKDPEHGYPYLAYAAAAAAYNYCWQIEDRTAWPWISGEIVHRPEVNKNPKWIIEPRQECKLQSAISTLSASQGGVVSLGLFAGGRHAGLEYGMLASASGTYPGTKVGAGLALPLNWDPITGIFFGMWGKTGPMMKNIAGKIIVDGCATAQIIVPPGVAAGLVGANVYFACVVKEKSDIVAVTNPVHVEIVE